MNSKQMPEELMAKMSKLTKKEKQYFRSMWPKSGVLYITSKPGIAKSAIVRTIAEKLGYAYKDLRLAMVDETDVGLFPSIGEIETGIDYKGDKIFTKCLDHVVPKWAIDANKRPTIIHFEELNRASAQVRNAALQLLLERAIGTEFHFNDNVLMIASGNLGDEDGTDVEEFDAALNGRLIHMKHTLSHKEWIEGYANEYVHPIIISYINAYPEYMYKETTEDGPKSYASPRTWTFLSDYIVANYGIESSPKEFIQDMMVIASSYVGVSAKKFITYCEDMMNLNIEDIINRYDEIKDDLSKYNRDKKSELIQSLKKKDIEGMTDFQRENVTKFLHILGEDELVDYLLGLLDVPNKNLTTAHTKTFLKQFKDVLLKTKGINKNNSNSSVMVKQTK